LSKYSNVYFSLISNLFEYEASVLIKRGWFVFPPKIKLLLAGFLMFPGWKYKIHEVLVVLYCWRLAAINCTRRRYWYSFIDKRTLFLSVIILYFLIRYDRIDKTCDDDYYTKKVLFVYSNAAKCFSVWIPMNTEK